ncbi:MAG: hybrid sensor histidine kinase/response regulator [Acidimicrobiales bacterium]
MTEPGTTPLPSPGASATPWESFDVQLARVRQFVLGDIAAALGGLSLLSGFYAVWQPTWVFPIVGAVVLGLIVLVWSLRLLAERRLSAAIFAVAASFWFVVPSITFVLPPAFGSFALATIWPVLLSTPYVDRSTLRRMAWVTLPVALLSLGLSLRGDPYGVEDTLGTNVLNVSLLGIGLAFAVLTLLMIWAYNSRLQDTLNGLSATNAQLTESERSLERKVAARTAELESASAYLQAVIENLPQGLITLDRGGNVLEVNRVFEGQFGVDAASEGLDGLPAPLRAAVESAAEGAVATGTASAFVDLAADRIGKATATPISVDAEDGFPMTIGSVVVVDDVTEERQIDRMKTDFISTVSHELRTPLTSVLGFARIIQKRLDDKVFPLVDPDAPGAARAMRQVEDNLAIILSEGGRLTNLINDVLDISKMEAREVVWERETLAVADLVGTAVQATSSLFADGEVPVVVDVPDDLPLIVGDRQRLVQVVINLLSNAQKFTDVGRIVVSAASLDAGSLDAGTASLDRPAVELRVVDSGIGVAEADMPLLFERFRQVGDSLTDRPRGTGLGLPICREIIEAHGGTIDAESTLGEGTTFRVVLPLEPAPAPTTGLAPASGPTPTPTSAPTPASGPAPSPGSAVDPSPVAQDAAHVLVVDDDDGVRALLRDLFETDGYRVSEASDGAAAVDVATRLQPDLVTMDVLMPGMSGIDTALALRTNVRTAAIPLVFVSVLDRLEGVPLGFDGHITKPIDAEALSAKAAELIADRDRRDAGVLVIDASAEVLESVVAGLDRFGFVPVPGSREEALDGAPDGALHRELDAAPGDDRAQLVIANAELERGRPVLERWRFRRGDHELLVIAFAEHPTESLEGDQP